MGLHLLMFKILDGKPVEDYISQALSTAFANILAIFVEVSLLGGIGVAYSQILWRLFRQKYLQVKTIDMLVTLVATPWNVFNPHLVLQVRELWLTWLVGLLCALIPIAAVFPPGALTVQFDNAAPLLMSNVATMNLSDYGNGTHRDFVEHALFEMNGDLSFMWAMILFLKMNISMLMMGRNSFVPKLQALSAQVLASGAPVKFASPCGSSCVYNLSLDGPRFHCSEKSHNSALMQSCQDPMYRAADQATASKTEIYSKVNNSFKLSWYPEPSSKECDPAAIRTLDCNVVLATYNLRIGNYANDTRQINRDITNERMFWNDSSWIQTQFYYYFLNGDGILPQPQNLDQLRTNFTHMQAYTISRAAVQALSGEVSYRM